MAVARSLLVFVGIGIASGLAVGVYLAEIRESGVTSVVRVDGPSISIIPTKSAFDEGEDITFLIINTGTVPLHSDDGVFGATITGLSGMVIYAFGMHDTAPAHKDSELYMPQRPEHTQGQPWQEASPHSAGMQDSSAPTAGIGGNGNGHDDGDAEMRQAHATPLLPGNEIVISWNQTRHDGESIQAGLYKINIRATVMMLAAGVQQQHQTAAAVPESVTISDSATVIIQ